MQKQYYEIRPLFEIMDEKIHASEFYDIIENKSQVSTNSHILTFLNIDMDVKWHF